MCLAKATARIHKRLSTTLLPSFFHPLQTLILQNKTTCTQCRAESCVPLLLKALHELRMRAVLQTLHLYTVYQKQAEKLDVHRARPYTDIQTSSRLFAGFLLYIQHPQFASLIHQKRSAAGAWACLALISKTYLMKLRCSVLFSEPKDRGWTKGVLLCFSLNLPW
jgi:hypothetical protein